jgi:hypothetical protein
MTKLAAADVVQDTLTIRNKKIPVTVRFLEQSKLKFFAENPRVYSVLRSGTGKEPSQEEIQEHLLEMDHVKILIQDIKANGGLIDPIIVKAGSLEVLEGNSRLAAYRTLAGKDPVKWGLIKSMVLPADIDEGLVFALLGQYHIKGKKDWAPFEQAGFLYRRSKKQKVDLGTLAAEIGLTQKKVKHLIETYEAMLNNGEKDTARWSYYDEYLKSSKIRKARETYPEFEEVVMDQIKSGDIPRAVDIREKLHVICSAKGKTLPKFIKGEFDFDEAFESAVAAGGDNDTYRKLEKFRTWLARPEVSRELLESKGQIRQKMTYELEKLHGLVQTLAKKMKAG